MLYCFISLFCAWVLCLPVCLYTVCMPAVHRGQKRANPLEPALKMGVSCHMGVGDQIWVLWKGSQYSQSLTHHLPKPTLLGSFFFKMTTLSYCVYLAHNFFRGTFWGSFTTDGQKLIMLLQECSHRCIVFPVRFTHSQWWIGMQRGRVIPT